LCAGLDGTGAVAIISVTVADVAAGKEWARRYG
jgi:hypothetical protein